MYRFGFCNYSVTKSNEMPCFCPGSDIALLTKRLIFCSNEQEVTMTQRDLTIAEVLKDPLIRQVMRADRISVTGMASLLQDAARRQEHALSANMAPITHAASCSRPQADLR
jgi:hypothetical protein